MCATRLHPKSLTKMDTPDAAVSCSGQVGRYLDPMRKLLDGSGCVDSVCNPGMRGTHLK